MFEIPRWHFEYKYDFDDPMAYFPLRIRGLPPKYMEMWTIG
jgi:hypothetical protein